MKITIIGSGNVATIFSRILHFHHHEIVQIANREIDHAKILAEETGAAFCHINEIDAHAADIYIIAVADSGIKEICSTLHLGNKPVFHTAGSVSINILQNVSVNYGVLYPLQSLRKEMKEIPPMPLMIDANNPETMELIQQLADSISKQVKKASDETRIKMHVAAVFACNFTNHLYQMADSYCKKEGLDFKQLFPLIQETAERIKNTSPESVQTGPAIRKDKATIQKHLELLQGLPELEEIYKTLTDSIIKRYS